MNIFIITAGHYREIENPQPKVFLGKWSLPDKTQI